MRDEILAGFRFGKAPADYEFSHAAHMRTAGTLVKWGRAA